LRRASTLAISARYSFALVDGHVARHVELARDIVYVAKQMGHSTTEMIHRHYARWLPDDAIRQEV